MEETINKLAEEIKKQISNTPNIGLILGSGLDGIVEAIEDKVEIDYANLRNMPKTNVVGHKNKFVLGWLGGKYIIAMLGRVHYYTSGDAKLCGLPIYLFKKLGVETLIVTNSAGSVNTKINQGNLVVIRDHINFTGQNPLINYDYDEGDSQSLFVDMSNAYDIKYVNTIKAIAKKNKIKVTTGVYMQFSGPSYETKAEVKMARKLGADVVGMSTALEVIVAQKCNMKVLGLSNVSNMSTGLSSKTLNHQEVLAIGKQATANMSSLIVDFIKSL